MSRPEFSQLYEGNLKSVHTYIGAKLPFDDVEDLTHDVFIKAFRAYPRYEDKGKPYLGYLRVVIHNAITDHYRSGLGADKKRELSTEIAKEDEEGKMLTFENRLFDPKVEDDPVLAYERNTRALKIREAVKTLPPTMQIVISLKFFEQWDYDEIGEFLGKSNGATRVILHRALRILRKQLKGEDL